MEARRIGASGSKTGAPSDARVELVALRRENLRLRRALLEEWESNHFEHCSREWPHPTGKGCHWPQPKILQIRSAS
jgi:hypothetical protein